MVNEEGGTPELEEVQMVAIPAGRYSVGDESSQHPMQGLPTREVSIVGFSLDATEVTVGDFAECVHAGVCDSSKMGDTGCNWSTPDKAKHPINCASFEQAKRYCQWVGKRLPTDDEWEIAIRLDLLNHAYIHGSEMERVCTTAESTSDCRALDKHRPPGTCEVGTNNLSESKLGLQDMFGNVAEWTVGEYCPWKTEWCKRNVVRGMAWCANWYDVPIKRRLGNETGNPVELVAPPPVVGFRCASSKKTG